MPVGRSIGSGSNDARLGRGGAGFTQVKSAIAGPGGKEARPLSSGARPARTDEEIQILFDRYKAALYRIYNTELRKDPTLRGKMVLRITIEPSGEVSACAVDSSNMNAPEFSAQIVDRVKKFNFGAKEGCTEDDDPVSHRLPPSRVKCGRAWQRPQPVTATSKRVQHGKFCSAQKKGCYCLRVYDKN